MRLAPAGAAGAAAILLAGCGGVRPADLFIVTRSGSTPHARLTLLVDEEGNVHCDGAAAGRLNDAQLVQARAIQEDLHDPASAGLSLPPRPGSVLGYVVREESGTVRFADNSSGQPSVLRRLALFVLHVAQQVCHRPE